MYGNTLFLLTSPAQPVCLPGPAQHDRMTFGSGELEHSSHGATSCKFDWTEMEKYDWILVTYINFIYYNNIIPYQFKGTYNLSQLKK
jgi:hypothetical protein